MDGPCFRTWNDALQASGPSCLTGQTNMDRPIEGGAKRTQVVLAYGQAQLFPRFVSQGQHFITDRKMAASQALDLMADDVAVSCSSHQ